jgi:cytochrome c oxidase subunit 6a
VLLWKRISLFLGFPAIILASVNAYLAHKEHEEKHVQPEFIPYEHLRIRTKVNMVEYNEYVDNTIDLHKI